MAITFQTYAPNTFYVMDNTGKKLAGGKDFVTLDAAIEAGKTYIRRRTSNLRAHFITSVDIRQAIPGNHVTCCFITPDLKVIVRN